MDAGGAELVIPGLFPRGELLCKLVKELGLHQEARYAADIPRKILVQKQPIHVRCQPVSSILSQLQELRGIGGAAPNLHIKRGQTLLSGKDLSGDALGRL